MGDDHVAYQVLGDGPPLVLCSGFASNVDACADEPAAVRSLLRLASFARTIVYDPRGSGASDHPDETIPPADRVHDLLAVMDACGVERATVIGQTDGAIPALHAAADHPGRVAALVLLNASARLMVDDDYPIGMPPSALDQLREVAVALWGTESLAPVAHPSRSDDERFTEWYARYARGAMGPKAVGRALAEVHRVDLRHLLARISCPTLVMHRRSLATVPLEHGMYLRDNLPGSELIELEGSGTTIGEDADELLDPIERFVTGASARPRAELRELGTILFTDIVASTEQLASIGDGRWGELLEVHDRAIRRWVGDQGGSVVNSTGDGAVALLPTPGRALRSAVGMRHALADLGLSVRVGIHAGEVERVGDGAVGGIAVHVAARVMGEADPGDIVVSATVRDLVQGSGWEFDDGGARDLKGVPERVRLYRLRDS